MPNVTYVHISYTLKRSVEYSFLYIFGFKKFIYMIKYLEKLETEFSTFFLEFRAYVTFKALEFFHIYSIPGIPVLKNFTHFKISNF